MLVANPLLANPVLDASEIEVAGRGRDGAASGRVALAGGFANHGEPVRLRLRRPRQGQGVLARRAARCCRRRKVERELFARYE